jgi:hypothetical protein
MAGKRSLYQHGDKYTDEYCAQPQVAAGQARCSTLLIILLTPILAAIIRLIHDSRAVRIPDIVSNRTANSTSQAKTHNNFAGAL